jgi:N-acetyl-anhydromuramoyl-L-alanine amidase
MHWDDQGWLDDVRCRHSPNYNARPANAAVSLIVIHNISLPPGDFSSDSVEHFFLNQLETGGHPYFAEIAGMQVSAHFFIRRNGDLVQFVSTDQRAWHAGKSAWQGQENCNDYSVGVELEGTDDLPYPAPQYEALWRLIDALRARYPISAVAGHCHIAPGRKTDPGQHFDWATLGRRYPTLELPPEIGF